MTKTILYAKNTNELITILNNNIGARVVGGCTWLDTLPEKAISTRYIPELSQITRHERYLDVGSGVTLAKLLEVGATHLPQILYDALNSIANPIIRNMATIGGNICSDNHKLSLYAPLMALDAKLELKNQTVTISESIRNLKYIPKEYLLTNVRIPIVDSDISIFKRIGPGNAISQQSASFAFLASTEKNSIVQLKLAFAGPFTFYSSDLENSLLGMHLPLSQKDITNIETIVQQYFEIAATDQMISDVLKQQFFNLTRYSFEQLT